MGQYSRKYDGPPVRELRRTDKDPAKVPPHKKPRVYELRVEYITTARNVYTAKFASKAARDQFRTKVEKDVREKRGRSWALWQYMAHKEDREIIGPEFTELLDGEITSPDRADGHG